MVLATRYAAGGSTGEWDQTRAEMSRFATYQQPALKQPVSDPMSGFFMFRRTCWKRTFAGCRPSASRFCSTC